VSEWQPVLIRGAHGKTEVEMKKSAEVDRKIMRARPIAEDQLDPVMLRELRLRGCDATQFVQIHPDDAAKYFPERYGVLWACEHQYEAD
jgi:hypothetical protein